MIEIFKDRENEVVIALKQSIIDYIGNQPVTEEGDLGASLRLKKENFLSDEPDPIVIFHYLRSYFGEMIFQSLPETTWQLINERLMVDILDEKYDKLRNMINCIKFIIGNKDRMFVDDFHKFEKTVLALNNIIPNFDIIELNRIEYIFNALNYMDILCRLDNEKFDIYTQISSEVLSYIATICFKHGYFALPYPLSKCTIKILHLLDNKDEIIGYRKIIFETVEQQQLNFPLSDEILQSLDLDDNPNPIDVQMVRISNLFEVLIATLSNSATRILK